MSASHDLIFDATPSVPKIYRSIGTLLDKEQAVKFPPAVWKSPDILGYPLLPFDLPDRNAHHPAAGYPSTTAFQRNASRKGELER